MAGSFDLKNIGLPAFRTAYTRLIGQGSPTRQSLKAVSQQLLRPVLEKQVNVPQEVFGEALALMGRVNIQLMKLPVSVHLMGGKEDTIDGKVQLDDERLGGLAWKGDSRTNCEDSILVAEKDKGTPREKILQVVCDGMGGEAHGEIASQAVIEKIEALFVEGEAFPPVSAVLEASKVLLALIASRSDMAGAGTTLALALVKPAINKAAIVHIGDSRFYVLRAKTRRLAIITRDDSLGNAVKGNTGIFPLKGDAACRYYTEANGFANKNVIMGALGPKEIKREEVHVKVVKLEEGDLLIGASDGLNFLEWDKLEQVLADNQDKAPKDIAEALKTALAGIAADNLGVTIYRHHVLPSDKKAAFRPSEATTGQTTDIWQADPTVKTAFIEEATKVLDIPAEQAARFAELVDSNAEYREAAMNAAKIALKRGEERDTAQKEVRRLTEQVATLETQARELAAANEELQRAAAKPHEEPTRVADANQDPTVVMEATIKTFELQAADISDRWERIAANLTTRLGSRLQLEGRQGALGRLIVKLTAAQTEQKAAFQQRRVQAQQAFDAAMARMAEGEGPLATIARDLLTLRSKAEKDETLIAAFQEAIETLTIPERTILQRELQTIDEDEARAQQTIQASIGQHQATVATIFKTLTELRGEIERLLAQKQELESELAGFKGRFEASVTTITRNLSEVKEAARLLEKAMRDFVG